jgi:hypothetical protein
MAWCASGINVPTRYNYVVQILEVCLSSPYKSMQTRPCTLVTNSLESSCSLQPIEHSPWLSNGFLLFLNWYVIVVIIQLTSILQSTILVFEP